MAVREKYRDDVGSDVPRYAPGHVYVGNVPTGRIVVYRSGSGELVRMKVVAQNEGSTTVRVARLPRSFRTTDGRKVEIRGGAALMPIAQGTVVQPAGGAS